jgi:hypothetical protein
MKTVFAVILPTLSRVVLLKLFDAEVLIPELKLGLVPLNCAPSLKTGAEAKVVVLLLPTVREPVFVLLTTVIDEKEPDATGGDTMEDTVIEEAVKFEKLAELPVIVLTVVVPAETVLKKELIELSVEKLPVLTLRFLILAVEILANLTSD